MKKFFTKNKKVILGDLFTALCLLVWRIGIHIQTPFLDYNPQVDSNGNIFGFLDIFTGGALSQFSVVALGVSPYITASIIVQLLQMDIIPQFKEWAEEGEAGMRKALKYLSRFTDRIENEDSDIEGISFISAMHTSRAKPIGKNDFGILICRCVIDLKYIFETSNTIRV